MKAGVLALLIAGACTLSGHAAASDPTSGAIATDPELLDNGAVAVMYHRFGETRYPNTNIRLEQFEAHIEELKGGGYSVLPLPEIVAALREGTELPDRAVAITIDDAYASVYQEAWPRLEEAGLPFTFFVSSGPVDNAETGMVTWDQLREMAESELVTIGNHTRNHPSLPELASAEVAAQITHSQARFSSELGSEPGVFAYPYGEYSTDVQEVVAALGFDFAFGQHSGAIGRTDDPLGLPRFALNEAFGDLDRFRLAVNAKPLPVTDVTPADRTVRPENNPPNYGFSVLDGVGGLGRLNCFLGGQTLEIERIANQRVEVRIEEPLAPGRARVNCTMPADDNRWRWFGTQFYVMGE